MHFPLQHYPASSDCPKMVPMNYQQLQKKQIVFSMSIPNLFQAIVNGSELVTLYCIE